MKKICLLMCALGMLIVVPSCPASCFIDDSSDSSSEGSSGDKSLITRGLTRGFPPVEYDKIELKLKDTYILRLGSSPNTRCYLPGLNEKSDNSYEALQSGEYETILAREGLPLKNVVHNSLQEQHKYAFELGYSPSISYDFKAETPATFGSISHITANFNLPALKKASDLLLSKIGSPVPLYDFIVTDERTTKFIVSDSGLHNILSLLNVGGIATFTDLDESYGSQFFNIAMAPKMMRDDWISGTTPHYNSAGIGLLDFKFNEFD